MHVHETSLHINELRFKTITPIPKWERCGRTTIRRGLTCYIRRGLPSIWTEPVLRPEHHWSVTTTQPRRHMTTKHPLRTSLASIN